MDIKEIALKVGLQAFEEHPYDKGHVVSPSGYTWIDDKLIEFAEAFIAEIAKQNEPVSFTNSGELDYLDFKREDSGLVAAAMWKDYHKDSNIALYTIPPTAEQIANETAEAIAEYCRKQDHYCLATEIESGAWKGFKK